VSAHSAAQDADEMHARAGHTVTASRQLLQWHTRVLLCAATCNRWRYRFKRTSVLGAACVLFRISIFIITRYNGIGHNNVQRMVVRKLILTTVFYFFISVRVSPFLQATILTFSQVTISFPSSLNCGFLTINVQTSSQRRYVDR